MKITFVPKQSLGTRKIGRLGMNEHEQAFVKKFISAQRQDRYFSLLSSARRRSKFRNRISHALFFDLDRRYLYEVNDLAPDITDSIRHLLSGNGSESLCHVMCDDADLDGKEMTFEEAECQWDALCGIIISIVPGQLVYYRPERPNKNYVLLRKHSNHP